MDFHGEESMKTSETLGLTRIQYIFWSYANSEDFSRYHKYSFYICNPHNFNPSSKSDTLYPFCLFTVLSSTLYMKKVIMNMFCIAQCKICFTNIQRSQSELCVNFSRESFRSTVSGKARLAVHWFWPRSQTHTKKRLLWLTLMISISKHLQLIFFCSTSQCQFCMAYSFTWEHPH